MIGILWMVFFLLSLVFGIITGRVAEVSQAAASGAAQAIEVTAGLAGTMMFWSGMMELVQRSGLSKSIQKCLRVPLKLIFGKISEQKRAMELVGANITANLLGLSNAATPIGLQAAKVLYKAENPRSADGVLTLIILNTASIQLIPTTVAALRSGLGCQTAYDIVPAVWAASLASVLVVLLASRVLRKVL